VGYAFTNGEAAANFFASKAFAVIFLQSVATSGSVSVRQRGPFHGPHSCTLHPSVAQTLREHHVVSKSVFCLCEYPI
jgi:hypothetical protein